MTEETEVAELSDDDLKAAFLAELDVDRRWDLLVALHERGWAYRPFNHEEPFAPRRERPTSARPCGCLIPCLPGNCGTELR